MNTTTLEQFYLETSGLVPEGISKDRGHFNVFSVENIIEKFKQKPYMPYNRRAYYKISLISGRDRKSVV